jgi:hypothetical protein
VRNVPVSKCLDKKLVLMGYEIADVLAIFLTLSVLNFVFGQGPLEVALVWLPTVLLAIVLRVGKRGKPDKYLIHWMRYQFQPGVFSAFDDPSVDEGFRKGKAL